MGEMRTNKRVHLRVDEFPQEARKRMDAMLADPQYTYQKIAEALTAEGYEISKSAIHRYASSMSSPQRVLRELGDKTRQLVQALKEGQDMDAAEVANALLLDALVRRIATAEEEMENMPLDKAMRLLVSLQNTTSFKVKATGKREKIVQEVQKSMLVQLRDAVQGDEALLARLTELVEQTGREVLADEG